ncbi:TIGR02450 family Trp-rich protein [Synechococcus elongatus]|uniref:TIGR02450 family Trp-rich protein n=1 Tax=Synechococcus elongatus PCC 11801 TaxID=2219813 RepID=A0AAN1QPE3_SYNEL|nr:TIGR02450 family Trp-rich protein [Synechococcus elongatus]AZB72944.1 TIGR02450 family Trp-rich protein [Synechococcus elongatus PCC 11801]
MARKQRFPFLVGSQWTAQQKTLGWRHFRVVTRKNQGKLVFAELVAACDEQVRLWVNAESLRDRDLWQPGWQPLQAIAAAESAQAD